MITIRGNIINYRPIRERKPRHVKTQDEADSKICINIITILQVCFLFQRTLTSTRTNKEYTVQIVVNELTYFFFN